MTTGSGAIENVFAVGAERLPAASTARTEKLCSPAPSPESCCGELQGAKSPPSTEHSNVAPVSPANVNCEVPVWVGSTGPGATVSMVTCRAVSGDALPAASVAIARSVCAPSARSSVVNAQFPSGAAVSPSLVSPS